MRTPQTQPNLPQLTWLRGIAAFWVICSHVVRATEVAYGSTDVASHSAVLSLLDLGTLGVALFFTLSGTTLYLSNRTLAIRSPIAFYIKRFFRIWPAYAIALIAYIAFGFVFRAFYTGPDNVWVTSQFSAEYGWLDIAQYLLLSFNFVGQNGLFNNAFWSLPVEFQYYLTFPLLILALRAHWTAPLALGALAYLAHRFGWIVLESNLLLIFFFTFCTGVVLGALSQRVGWRLHPALSLAVFLAILVLNSMLSTGRINVALFVYIPSEWVFYGLSAVMMVGLMVFSEVKLPSRVDRVLSHFGDISYSAYLYHNLIIACLVLVIPRIGFDSGGLRIWSVFVVTVAATYVLATRSYRHIEQPSMALGKRLANRSGATASKQLPLN
ncbi:acyltransferase family protein [Marinobacter sp. C2H3]|uniref:acyltransferase family protein n=1 Tax=Marinobacter sp. C2H3 TaxID=3119003 RepID=UPI00300F07F6